MRDHSHTTIKFKAQLLKRVMMGDYRPDIFNFRMNSECQGYTLIH